MTSIGKPSRPSSLSASRDQFSLHESTTACIECCVTMTSINSKPFSIEIQAPPGDVVAPHGFPADPRPKDAPPVFRDAMDIRIKVFCDEQKCALEPELDEDDPKSWSWVTYQTLPGTEVKKTPVSTLRIVPPPHPPHPNGFHDPTEEPYIKLTRVATLKEARGQRLFQQLLAHAFEDLQARPALIGLGWNGLVLTHAQVTVEGMYAKLGFVADERLGRWDEEGIAHVGMWKRLKLSST